ncbi:DUF6276 family protein [Natronolimnobius baerhuensis]|uniref:Small CPxCG-related zinc finger protein n=1 Tax=Natronolimnobius baerhuensis TaxID=253108 RepID=A0A202E9Y2_9EURY|nr:DUF6276 family protein [Natronolimnobius baerhuensis]OVE85052.1 hypothetical protein B2G88_11925 [Natronolimnobius baerhuensis]
MTSSCASCDAPTITFALPEEYRSHVPDDAASICTRCLTLEAVAERHASGDPDFSRISDAFPTRLERAIPLALALGLCSSLATNREALESLLRAVEQKGTDPLLVIDRLCADPTVEPAIDLERRQHQLEQLLY